jgi:hypothetical protein
VKIWPLLLFAACTPDVAPGTYDCGPSQACPPNLRCDGPTDTCVLPTTAHPFVCPAGTNLAEPDDDVAHANDIGDAACGIASFSETGCIDKLADGDLVAFHPPAGCATVLVKLRFPVGFMPLGFDILDDGGAVVARGAVTIDIDESSQTHVDLQSPITGGRLYYVRVRPADDHRDGDCDGACAYNWYQLSIL